MLNVDDPSMPAPTTKSCSRPVRHADFGQALGEPHRLLQRHGSITITSIVNAIPALRP
jgi:hypothetical protein